MEYYSANKEQTTDIYYVMNQPRKHRKWKHPDISGYILYDSVFMTYSEKTNL